jgi:hypothetical protein
MYISGLSEYITLLLSNKSFTASSDDKTIMILVPRISEYIGLERLTGVRWEHEAWARCSPVLFGPFLKL